jgi:hypothetical protein
VADAGTSYEVAALPSAVERDEDDKRGQDDADARDLRVTVPPERELPLKTLPPSD